MVKGREYFLFNWWIFISWIFWELHKYLLSNSSNFWWNSLNSFQKLSRRPFSRYIFQWCSKILMTHSISNLCYLDRRSQTYFLISETTEIAQAVIEKAFFMNMLLLLLNKLIWSDIFPLSPTSLIFSSSLMSLSVLPLLSSLIPYSLPMPYSLSYSESSSEYTSIDADWINSILSRSTSALSTLFVFFCKR